MASKILKFFLPKDRLFFTLFENASANLELIASNLVLCVNELDFNKRAVIIKDMEDLEHKNDLLTHQIFIELSQNFITPFDREDIHSLATALDDIADYIYSVGKKINLYKIDPSDPSIKKMADAIKESVLAVNSAVTELRDLKNTQKVMNCIIKINSIENQADDLFDSSIENLFDNELDIKTLIKKREIYKLMEIVTDKCEDAGNVMESIIVKYA
jgi:predicted phosphate transport protein (TIGR00153 family)